MAKADPEIPDYARALADYGAAHRSAQDYSVFLGARVSAVRPDSPADDAGICPGMAIVSVAGKRLTDMIVWLWEADGDEVDLVVFDPSDGALESCTLTRFVGEDWGLTFEDAIFDGMRTCVNACLFCFMAMLPKESRKSLSIRDDDYRLSFLQGNFVTLTNMDDTDVAEVIEKHLSPMNVSIHAISEDVRRRLIGKHAHRGIEVLEELMNAGIEIHGQIVLCPGINDGEELEKTLAFCERHPEITSLGIVPLGFTKHQRRFTSSYSDDPSAARRVIAQVEPYQARAYERFGRHTFQLSDEFYVAAKLDPPPADHYDGYPQFYDGIGMIRSFMDETDELIKTHPERFMAIRRALEAAGCSLMVLSGEAAVSTVAALVESPLLQGRVLAIKNLYFGGNVNVTGLICAEDILAQLDRNLSGVMLILPSIIFNAQGLTLDGYDRDKLLQALKERGARPRIAPTTPAELLSDLEEALGLDH
ncbi:DUF512 domain-containing protein [Collinsella sp. AGMB00827]|uniref:DUF512 domain-containing protein n=1 Tax=Collinsella ureilytica TaxID=2869515 RepID=A0ABS7ML46_9ACTN|nr:DUF512 domain-containing protein [Collinsella urealyticum]MBY4798017.1 DUF512 domain-containing protein [Collinsella urealyticum]